MNCIAVNKFHTYTLYYPKVLFSIIIESEKLSQNLNFIVEKKNNDKLDIIKLSMPKPVYFYKGPDHVKSCIYSDNQYNSELLPYLTKRLKKHKDLKKFNDTPLRDYINTNWKKLKNFVYVNTITSVVRFDNLNNKISIDTLLELKKDIQSELCIDNKILLKLKKEYEKSS